MIKLQPYCKIILLFLIAWQPLLLFGSPIPIGNQVLKDAIPLQPFLKIYEDTTGTLTADQLYLNQSAFIPISQHKPVEPDNNFWLSTDLRTASDLDQRQYYIVFSHLTFVDLYLYREGQIVSHKLAGAFREKQFLAPENSRLAFNITLEPATHYTLLFKVKHVKKYQPHFDFVLQDTFTALSSKHQVDLINSFLLGTIAVLLIYTATLWIINRYRPYLWLFLFVLGIGLYSFALRPYFIDTFFPEHPKVGWLLIFPFLHLGLIGFYLLMIDFLDMRKNAPLLYTYSHYLVKAMIVFSFISLLHDSLTGNYYLTNRINLYTAPVHLGYTIFILIHLRKKLNSAQRYLLYGIRLFGLAVLFIAISYFIFQEQSLNTFPIVAKSTIACISVLFLVGLHKRIQQDEQEKIIALQQLHDLQLQYNTRIEKKVQERTLSLKNTNENLIKYQTQLLEKNRHIEILMDELNHRVKNNLQMLYSLNTLQLPIIKDNKSKQILNEMRSRIKAMMVVNEYLHSYRKDQSITLSVFIDEIARHLQQIYDRDKHIEISALIPDDIKFQALEALPFGLLLTELFTNTYKHAFNASHPQPMIKLRLFTENEQIKFTFEDNGHGADHYLKINSMGIPLIQDLTRQLKGTVSIQHEVGFSYQFTFFTANQYAHLNY